MFLGDLQHRRLWIMDKCGWIWRGDGQTKPGVHEILKRYYLFADLLLLLELTLQCEGQRHSYQHPDHLQGNWSIVSSLGGNQKSTHSPLVPVTPYVRSFQYVEELSASGPPVRGYRDEEGLARAVRLWEKQSITFNDPCRLISTVASLIHMIIIDGHDPDWWDN